jgi:lysophospholipase L1-like esterase
MNLAKSALLALCSMLLTFGMTLGVDRLIGGVGAMRSNPISGINFPPNSAVRYRTSEFDITATINNLGFRDHRFETRRDNTYRIVVIGDSFTFGWGVEGDESWPKVLERTLRARGVSVEVANLGKPGAGPVEYAAAAERALPLLKPDLVVVGVLQGEDLAQSLPPAAGATGVAGVPGVKSVAREALSAAYPNVIGLVRARQARFQDVRPVWQDVARSSLQQWSSDPSSDKLARYERLSPDVKERFLSGDVNPGMVWNAVEHPDYFAMTLDPARPDNKASVQRMSAMLVRIEAAARSVEASTLVVSVPYGPYLNDRYVASLRHLGYELDESAASSDAPDAAIRAAASGVGLPFCEVTAVFRDRTGSGELYFPYDHHFTAAGQALFGESISGAVQRRLAGQAEC